MDLYNDPTVIKIPLTCQSEELDGAHSNLLAQLAADDLRVIATEVYVDGDGYSVLVKFAPQDRFHYQCKYK